MLAAAIFHAVSLARANLARLEYGPDYPVWRHLLFIGVDVTCAWMFRIRARWFVWAWAALTAQQLYSHGTAEMHAWNVEHRVDWISIVVVIGGPALLAALIVDQRRTIDRSGILR